MLYHVNSIFSKEEQWQSLVITIGHQSILFPKQKYETKLAIIIFVLTYLKEIRGWARGVVKGDSLFGI